MAKLFFGRRKSPRDIFDYLVTRELRYLTMSATPECRTTVARYMYGLTVRICLVSFFAGALSGAVGALLGGM